MNKIFLISTILGVLNNTFNSYEEYKYFIFLELIFLLFLFLRKKYKMLFIYHVIFMLTSTNFFGDTRLIGKIALINYSKLKLINNISYSYLPVILLLCISFFEGRKNRLKNLKNKKLKIFILCFFILFVIAFILGIIGIELNQGYTSKILVQNTIYMLNFFSYFYILISLFTREDYSLLRNLLKNLLKASIIISVILSFLNVKGHYGGLEKISSIDIIDFSPLIFLYKDSKIFSLIYLSILKDSVNGKSLVFLLLIMFYFIMKIKSNYKFLFIFLLIFLFFSMDKIIDLNTDTMLYHKYFQLKSMLLFWNFDDIPHSPKIRIGEMINLIYEYINKPMYLLFGKGYGGYYQDHSLIFSTLKLGQRDFSELDILTGKYHTVHDAILPFLLYHGFIGIIMYVYNVVYFLKQSKKEKFALVSLFWLGFIFYFNIHFLIFGIISTYIVFIKTQPISAEKNI